MVHSLDSAVSSTGGVTGHNCNHSKGDSAWMLMATVLVLGMFPGLAFFEAGLLRKKNTISIMTQVFIGMTILSVMWIFFGYSLTFSGDENGIGFIGNLQDVMLSRVSFDDCYKKDGTIPTALFCLFQMMFACITPLLMTGAYAERLAWKPFLFFTIAWEILVYYPVAHWMWCPTGWLNKLGAQDFAGGIVIHTTAGVSSLVAVSMLGHRHNFKKYQGEFPYSSLVTAGVGLTLLWTGWFGFNGGSALMASSQAVASVFNSQIAAATAACIFVGIEGYKTGHPSTIAMMNGAIGGLAGVTPASGFIGPQAAVLLGILLGFSIEGGVDILKKRLHFDDALDVSTVHGVTGVIGSLFIGIAGNSKIGGADGLWESNFKSFKLLNTQFLAVGACGLWAGVFTFLILKTISKTMPLRIHHKDELRGLDEAVFQPTEMAASVFVGPHHKEGPPPGPGAIVDFVNDEKKYGTMDGAGMWSITSLPEGHSGEHRSKENTKGHSGLFASMRVQLDEDTDSVSSQDEEFEPRRPLESSTKEDDPHLSHSHRVMKRE